MFALIAIAAIGYVVSLAGVGIYIAVRAKSGRDYFVSKRTRLAAMIVFALLSVIPTDILTAIWLSVVRDYVDVSTKVNLFLMAVAPVVAVLVAVQALLLARAYRPRPMPNAAIFVALYAAAHATWLNILFNPLPDIIGHAVVILIVGSIVMAVVGRLVWRR